MAPLDQATAWFGRAEPQSGPGHLGWIGVARNGSSRRGPCSASPKAALTALRDYSGRSAIPLRVVRENGLLAATLTNPPAEAGAVFLANAEPAQVHCPQQTLSNVVGVPVVTDQETSAIALTAALLTSVSRSGLRPRASRLVIAEAATLPVLHPLLVAAGFADIAQWSRAEAEDVPLKVLARGASAIIDLSGDSRGMGTPGPRWIAP